MSRSAALDALPMLCAGMALRAVLRCLTGMSLVGVCLYDLSWMSESTALSTLVCVKGVRLVPTRVA